LRDQLRLGRRVDPPLGDRIAHPLQRIDGLQQQLGHLGRQRGAALAHQAKQIFRVMRHAFHAGDVHRPG